jgi:hypothetical protein
MSRLRWKSSYLTGEREVDEGNKALVGLLTDFDRVLKGKEHCQDMNELYADLTGVVEERLAAGARVAAAQAEVAGSDGALRQLLKTRLPLPARITPACRECGLCDLLDEKVTEWLKRGGRR